MYSKEYFFKILDSLNITNKELSDAIGVSTGNISDWKSGKSRPNIDAICKTADHLNYSVDYLLGRTDNPLSHKIPLEGKPSVSPSKEMQIRKNVSLADYGEVAAEGGELNSAPKKRKKETTL